MADPFKLVMKSLTDFKNNLILVMPTFLGLGLYSILAVFIILQVLFGSFLFKSLSPGLILFVLFFSIIDVVFILIINTFTLAAQLGLLSDAALIGKSSFSRLFKHGQSLFRQVLTYTLAKFLLIFLIPVVIILSFGGLAFLISPVVGSVIAVILSLLYIVVLIIFSVLTIFSAPILISRKLSGFNVIIESFKYGKSHFEHVILAAAVILVLWIIISIISTTVGIPYLIIDFMQELNLLTFNPALLGVYIISNVLSTLISLIGSLIISLFVFNSYFDKNSFKVWK